MVEDNQINQRVAKAILRELNYTVDVAENGRERLLAMARSEDDAVLMDCQMPVLGGIDATIEARRLEIGRRIPIIAMTAQAASEDQAACLEAGMDDFIAKPISVDLLDQILDRWIADGSRTPDE